MLSVRDVLSPASRRILVAGVSGSGKTTLAARISSATDIPHTEIDGLAHGTGWERRPTFAQDVEQFTRADRWVTEWQYQDVRELLAQRADTLIWLDLPTALTMNRVIREVEHWLRSTFQHLTNGAKWGFRRP